MLSIHFCFGPFGMPSVNQPFSLMGPHWGWKLVTRVCVTDLSETNFF